MSARQDWDRVRKSPRGYEEASPTRKTLPGPHTNIKRAPVLRWADMTPEQRAEIERQTKPKK